jgi:hypothetical protein
MTTKSIPLFERNSFVLRQLLHPGWVKYMYLSVALSIVLRLSIWFATDGFDAAQSVPSHLPEPSMVIV